MSGRFTLLLVVSVHLACSGGITRDQAARLIAANDSFTTVAHFAILTDAPLVSICTCQKQADLERTPLNRFLVQRGWVRYETRRAIVGLQQTTSCPAIVLTPAGEVASAPWKQRPGPTRVGTEWIVPIGRRELVGVTGLTNAPDGSTEVMFDWRWTPNETGTALRTSVPETDRFFQPRTTPCLVPPMG